APPKVSSASFNYLTTQSVQIQFSDDVSATLSAADVTVKNLTTGATIPTSVLNDGANKSATITFPGNLPLADGNYQITIAAAGVSGAGGQLDGNGDGISGDDYTFSFIFLNADANHDQHVNTLDFNLLAMNFGQLGRNFAQGDFNYDHITNALD